MAVPKRKHSKQRTAKRTFINMKRDHVTVVKTKDGKGYKRPHVDEYIEL
ncbi:50S ribosomal protein L32 [candidate division WWE3 bacterium RIFOXYC1_FULL_40_10]|uniref:Large ribosomal subunit protein bL32 n=1 Tax=candidate division WWE3 bacterium RIFOXYA2_FULL_46_9 TaxID=1802636 RepID=A0A1F4W200_UNCKA|nr:MAG: 50S ribosomal protein L32 [candidate division WWE3 bacterium RIFOXYB1_FULL_40_22]OGC61512.1 MAG: 50S ribosomal protein L32 [candidate division WWE3 bacterium RIFOXYA1_FULL_40_11]OGC63444.1 MAG: 50S ribosomal protein L32 [candidate division WWE3 bacterium RIFOXYA2_FULL_46_9]OGC64808.1 MAG: 50S ribosomal protein L32 [candidate division WWE3 bacterium RIFOXYB2_FULL_41_6]OGC65895.1 MAG: 50S ribosomal protein L32 [candidate division WWE3 bacterium RIFOXYC1_FULL_40_10]OGC67416.1 MAG: 50S rib